MPIEAPLAGTGALAGDAGLAREPTAIDSVAVNGWRGPGAIAIAFAHLGIATDALSARFLFPVALLVDLFFVLSGLVIAQAYAHKLATPSNIPEYVIRRFGRIWPVQAATLALLIGYESLKLVLEIVGHSHFSTPAFSHKGPALVAAIPSNLMLVQSLGLHDRETWNYPSWSLSVEFACYVCFALFCLLTPKLRRILSVATIVASIAVLAFVAPFGMRSTFDYGIFRCLAGFFAGTLCYDVAKRRATAHWRYPNATEIAAVVAVLVWLAFGFETWAGFAAPLVFAYFVLAFLGGGGELSRVLRTPLLQRLAELSFSIYMVHALVLLALLSGLHAVARHSDFVSFREVPNPFAGYAHIHPTVEVLHVAGVGQALLIALVYGAGVTFATLAAYRMVEVPGRALFNGLAKRLARRVDRLLVPAGHASAPALDTIGRAS